MTRDCLVLTGMMGTGKTTVGRLLAQRLDRAFIDLDDEIEKEAGATVAEIFAREGEDEFRAREVAAVRRLARTRSSVIATGGWTMGASESRTTLESLGPCVVISCAPEALSERLDASEAASRPLLGDPKVPGELERLLAARRSVYDSLPLLVDTTERSAEDVAELVLALVRATAGLDLNALPVATPTGGYSVLIGTGLLDALGAVLAARGLDGPAVIVTDPPVGQLYGERVADGLDAAGIAVRVLEMGEGEAAKSLSTIATLYDGFLNGGLARDGTVVALGGGVVGDTAGFAAATFMRGVNVVQVPTTLLAMVDASIGGKTGVNLPQGKNLVGAFKHPALVATDPSALATLPPEVLRGGLAEVVKVGLIADVGLLERLEEGGAPSAHDADAWVEIVGLSAAVKTLVVSLDPEERGQRAVLNLGHTFAHALERTSGYTLSHGEAVSVGLVAAARLAERLGIAETGLSERVERLLSTLDLPVRHAGPSPDEIVAAMSTDKKRHRSRLRFVLPREPGEVHVVDDVPADDVRAVVSELMAGASDS